MGGAGRAPLTMLPGLLCDAQVFAPQLARFEGSTAIDGFRGHRALGEMAEYALAEAPARMSLLGHSMGGRVAFEMMRRAPERIERLALVSTGTHLPAPGEAAARHALLDLGRAEGAGALVDTWLPPMIAPANLTPALYDPLRTMCVAMGTETYASQVAALIDRPEVESLLPTVGCPVLVAVGDQDGWSPPEQHRRLAAAIPGARLTIVADSGHMLPVERPDAFNDAIAAWLAMPVPQFSS